jgi:hypothetical protein
VEDQVGVGSWIWVGPAMHAALAGPPFLYDVVISN